MKRKDIMLVLCAVCFLIPFRTAAQDKTEKPERPAFKQSIAIQPLYLHINGLRLDYERQLKTPRQWVQVSGIGYYSGNDDSLWGLWAFDDHRFNNSWGAGVEVNYKYLTSKRVYLSGGLSYGYTAVDYNDYTLTDYEEDGLTYYTPTWEKTMQNFNRLGVHTYVGLQTKTNRRVLVDGYMGVGYTHSFYDTNKYYPSTNEMNNVSYRGIQLIIGFRMGIRL
ncbi:MAG: autotransporter outer membrane beta-barrel domain-containing protein [Tannerellaceae bacterium]|jgi:hypothetical protein|nr:autotransporter outer membrane beta-barrel domain-containing protein [Tannerellaceae bacterium]